MKLSDLEYICTAVANLSGIPVRLLRGGEQVFYASVVDLEMDPAESCKNALMSITDNVGYYVTERFDYYGIINSGEYKLVIGPTRQTEPSETDIRELAFEIDIPPENVVKFIMGMKSIVTMPFESVVQMLCVINFALNGDKLNVGDITIRDEQQRELVKTLVKRRSDEVFGNIENVSSEPTHNTYDIERRVADIVSDGNTDALKEWVLSAPAVRGGVLASEQLRQVKNTFIVTATVVSRAAVRGGMTVEDAFSLSDDFIRKCELLSFPDAVINLQYRMVLEFTERVGRLKIGSGMTRFTSDVANYVRHHISEKITADEIANALYMSRPYLSARFIRETGISVTEYVLREKTEEAKKLLEYTDRPILAVGEYLGFSSQSHFTRVFKKMTGLSPGEYRKNRR